MLGLGRGFADRGRENRSAVKIAYTECSSKGDLAKPDQQPEPHQGRSRAKGTRPPEGCRSLDTLGRDDRSNKEMRRFYVRGRERPRPSKGGRARKEPASLEGAGPSAPSGGTVREHSSSSKGKSQAPRKQKSAARFQAALCEECGTNTWRRSYRRGRPRRGCRLPR
jgi:hypothetical protein